MAITQPKAKTASIEHFIAGAPDAANKPGVRERGKKAIITLSIDPALLSKLDSYAARRGMSRAAVVSMAVGNLDGMLL